MAIGIEVGRPIGRAMVAALYAAPWAWLVSFASFTAAVAYKVGHFPSYSNPDPKHVADLNGLYTLTVVLLLPVLLSPVLLGTCAVWALLSHSAYPVGLWRAVAYVLGYALIVTVLFGDAFGLAAWYFD
jgi:hypothetical protein